MLSVGSETAVVVEPMPTAKTRSRTRWPTSAALSVYVGS